MPTYTCTAVRGWLRSDQKSRIAAAVTRAHADVTGAPASFAQVIFQDVAPGDHFIGGVPLAHDHVFVYGRIRAGRSATTLNTLIERLTEDVATAAAVPVFSVWVYLLELAPERMVEFGRVLPPSGAEAAWLDELPAEDRERLQRLGGERLP